MARLFDIGEGEEYPVLFVSELSEGEQAYEFLGLGREVAQHPGWELPEELWERWRIARQTLSEAEEAVESWWRAARKERFGV